MSGLRESVDPLITGKVSREGRRALYGSLTLYTFRGCTQKDIRSVLERYQVGFDLLTWRRSLHNNGQLMKNCKVWLYNSFVRGTPLPASFASVSQADRNTLTDCLQSNRIRDHLSSLVAYGAEPLTIDSLDSLLCESLYSRDVNAYFRSMVRKKLGFVVRTHGMNVSDLVDELRIGALFTLLRSYPRYEDVGHMKAICKAQAHNQTINLIHSYTTSSRQRLALNSDGTYSSLMVPITEFGTDGSPDFQELSSSYLVTGLDGATQSRWEQSFALRELSESSSISPKQRMFLQLMLGTPNGEFSGFIGSSNEDAVEEMPHGAYMKKVCQYLGVTIGSAKAFLQSTKALL
jgi:hypothetical protein